MVLDIKELTAFTKLNKNICLHVLEMVERECGEIGNPLIEDDCISLEVYRGYFDDAPLIIQHKSVTLKIIDKFDDPFFTLCYKIIQEGKRSTK
jgi:hypothetical protein